MTLPLCGLSQTTLAPPEWVSAQDIALWLTASEQARWQEFASEARRRDWLAGRLAAKRLLRETQGIAPLQCVIGRDGLAPAAEGAEMGRLNLSLSHSAGLGAASWADTWAQGTVGIDAQIIRPVHPGLAARILGTTEHETWQDTLHLAGGQDNALLLFWALKEAALKARRLPWGRALREIAVTLSSDGAARITLPGEETPFAATYARIGAWWIARAVRPSPGSLRAPQ